MERTDDQLMYSNLKTLARCYATGEFEPLFPLLADDVALTSMWVLETLSGIEKVKDYYIGKGETVRKHHCLPVCSIVRSLGHPQGKLLIYMRQYLENETAKGIISVKLDENGKIRQIDLCDKNFFRFEPFDYQAEAEEFAARLREQSPRLNPLFGNNAFRRELRDRRAEIFQQTVNLVQSGSYPSPKNGQIQFPDPDSVAEQTVFYSKRLPENRKHPLGSTEITVQNLDCVLAGKQLQDEGFSPAILNMASSRNPGGGVLSGAGAQEENLFRRSNLFRSMYQFADFAPAYGMRKSEDQYPLDPRFGGVYTPEAFFFRGTEADGYPMLDEPITLPVISVAAVNLITGRITLEDYLDLTREKIRTILRIGVKHGHDALVLSAFGCGAFRNDPYVVAALFLEILHSREFSGSFRKIVFAIIDDHNSKGNFKAFSDVIH